MSLVVAVGGREFGFGGVGGGARENEGAIELLDLLLEVANVAGCSLVDLLEQGLALGLEAVDRRLGVVDLFEHSLESILVSERGDNRSDTRAEQRREVAIQSLTIRDDGRDESFNELKVAHAKVKLGGNEEEVFKCAGEEVERSALRVLEDGVEAAARIRKVHPDLLLHVVHEFELVVLRIIVMIRNEATENGVVEDRVLVEDAPETGGLHARAKVQSNLEVALLQ